MNYEHYLHFLCTSHYFWKNVFFNLLCYGLFLLLGPVLTHFTEIKCMKQIKIWLEDKRWVLSHTRFRLGWKNKCIHV